MHELIIDPEFRDLIEPLSNDELEILEKNVIKHGILDPIKVWSGENIILDGHNRYELAKKHNLEYKVEYLEFPSREDALSWEIDNQLGRRNLSDVYRMDLVDKQKELLARQAKKNLGGDHKSEKFKASKENSEIKFIKNDKLDFDDSNIKTTIVKSDVSAGEKPANPRLIDVPIEVLHVPSPAPMSDAFKLESVEKVKTALEATAIQRQQTPDNTQSTIARPKVNTQSKLAELAGVSTGKYAQYEQLKKKRPDLLQKARDKELTVGGAYTAMKKDEKKQAKAEEVKKAQSYIASQEGKGSAVLYVEDSVGISKPCDLLLTDPPYMTDVDDIGSFVKSWLHPALNGVKPTGFAYVFCGAYPEELKAYLNATIPGHMHLEQVLVWEYKNTLGQSPKRRYKQNWQACLFYRGAEAPDLDCPLTNEQWAVQSVNAPDGRLGDRYHAWQKPLELCERFIRHSTEKCMTVYDPFACTGTTLVAAAKLGRHGVGYEIDPKNAEIAFGRGVANGGVV